MDYETEINKLKEKTSKLAQENVRFFTELRAHEHVIAAIFKSHPNPANLRKEVTASLENMQALFLGSVTHQGAVDHLAETAARIIAELP